MAKSCAQLSTEPEKIEALVEDCVARLRSRGLRRSKALDALLRHMASHHQPATLADLSQARGLAGCDQATVYRLVMKLELAGLVRRLGLHERSTYFQLVIPGHHHDYLVCTECGSIQDLDLRCPVEELEQKIMRKSGFRQLYHELEFYGICPGCVPDSL